MKIYDIFCDASALSGGQRGACAGCLVCERMSQHNELHASIQPTGTNNSGEIGALMNAVYIAGQLKEASNDVCYFNIFSDSIISIRGVREWIFHWIYNANKKRNNILTLASGVPVSNQIYFKIIFNQIILNRLDIHFYHQIGHGTNKYEKIASSFYKNNGIPIMRLGLTAEFITSCNEYVDGRTRDILRQFVTNGHMSMSGVWFDNLADEFYGRVTENVPVPVICDVCDNEPSESESFNFSMLNGKSIIETYAKLIHALEYPGGENIRKYIL